MTGTALFVFDLVATGLICVVGTQAFRFIQRLRHRDDGSGNGMLWRHTPSRPGGSSPRGATRRPPLRGGGAARPGRRALR